MQPFRVVDYANCQISQTASRLWVAGIHQAEPSDVWEVCAAKMWKYSWPSYAPSLWVALSRAHWDLHLHLYSPLSSRLQKMPNGSLVISDVTADDTGRYTCVAGNSCNIKDRVAQLYVVGEFVTHIHAHTNILTQASFIRNKGAHMRHKPGSQVQDEGIN